MTASSLAATVTNKLKTKGGPPDLSRTTFKGDPELFRDIVWDFCVQEKYERGKPILRSDGVDKPSQGKDETAISFFGTLRTAPKRLTAQFECHLLAKAVRRLNQPVISRLRLELVRGTWDSQEGQTAKAQITALLDYLRSADGLDEE